MDSNTRRCRPGRTRTDGDLSLRPASAGRGRLTSLVAGGIWRVASSAGRKGRLLAGPLGAGAAVAVWALLQIFGCALIYLPHIPQGFMYSRGIHESRYPDFMEALYFSIVSVSTLGLGEVVPTDSWVRLFAPLQALIGFAILTAAVSWYLQLYPALGRRRAFALHLSLLKREGIERNITKIDPTVASTLLNTLTAGLCQTRADLMQSSDSYYFSEGDPDDSLPARLDYCLRLARQAQRSKRETVRISGSILEQAVVALADTLQSQFLQSARTTEQTLRQYAEAHGQR